MAQLVERLPLGFGSGHDLIVSGFKPLIGICADSAEPAWDSLSPPLSVPTLLVLSLSQNELKKKKRNSQNTRVCWIERERNR